MAQISQMELQSVRELVGQATAGARKFSAYAEQCRDEQLRSSLQQQASKCQQKAEKLMGFLR